MKADLRQKHLFDSVGQEIMLLFRVIKKEHVPKANQAPHKNFMPLKCHISAKPLHVTISNLQLNPPALLFKFNCCLKLSCHTEMAQTSF